MRPGASTCECHGIERCPGQPLSQAEREAATYNAYMAAVRRKDFAEVTRLSRELADVHAQRAPAVVEALERAKGLR